MREIEFISGCLSFQGWEVKKWHLEGEDVHVWLEPVDVVQSSCGECGCAVSVRKGFLPGRTVRHLGFWHRKTFLHFRQRRFHCPRCRKVVPEHLEWCAPYRRHTVMFEQLCASLCDRVAVTDVARQMQVDKMALYAMDEAWIGLRAEKFRVSLEGIRYLGIDEIMVGRREESVLMDRPSLVVPKAGKASRKRACVVRPNFATLVYDLGSGRLVAIAEGRDSKTAVRLLKSLGKDVLSGVEAVCMDMAACYKKAVSKVLPTAKIVFDRFHVKKYVNEAVEEVRKVAQAEAEGEGGMRKFIFNQRWLLLRSEPEEKDRWRLESLFEVNKDLALAYQLKDQFDAIFTLGSRAEAERELGKYISYCARSRLPSFRTLSRRLARWKPHLLNYFDHPITNGMVEGMNNVVKRVLYRGFGYRNMRYFFGKARVATGDLPEMTELGVSIAENRFGAA